MSTLTAYPLAEVVVIGALSVAVSYAIYRDATRHLIRNPGNLGAMALWFWYLVIPYYLVKRKSLIAAARESPCTDRQVATYVTNVLLFMIAWPIIAAF